MTDDPTHDGPGDDELALLALDLDPVAPAPGLKSRLMATVQGPERYAPFAPQFARVFDLAVDASHELFRSLHDPSVWKSTGDGGFVHFTPGPGLANFHAGFIEGGAGHHIPMHRHRGREITMVLRGSIIEGDGTVHGPGAVMDLAAGTEHEVTIGDGEAVFALAFEK